MAITICDMYERGGAGEIRISDTNEVAIRVFRVTSTDSASDVAYTEESLRNTILFGPATSDLKEIPRIGDRWDHFPYGRNTQNVKLRHKWDPVGTSMATPRKFQHGMGKLFARDIVIRKLGTAVLGGKADWEIYVMYSTEWDAWRTHRRSESGSTSRKMYIDHEPWFTEHLYKSGNPSTNFCGPDTGPWWVPGNEAPYIVPGLYRTYYDIYQDDTIEWPEKWKLLAFNNNGISVEEPTNVHTWERVTIIPGAEGEVSEFYKTDTLHDLVKTTNCDSGIWYFKGRDQWLCDSVSVDEFRAGVVQLRVKFVYDRLQHREVEPILPKGVNNANLTFKQVTGGGGAGSKGDGKGERGGDDAPTDVLPQFISKRKYRSTAWRPELTKWFGSF